MKKIIAQSANQQAGKDASLTGCRDEVFSHFLPSDAFLKECCFIYSKTIKRDTCSIPIGMHRSVEQYQHASCIPTGMHRSVEQYQHTPCIPIGMHRSVEQYQHASCIPSGMHRSVEQYQHPSCIPIGMHRSVKKIIMANTFTQIHIHSVFAVQNRISLIKGDWQDRLYKYIIAIIQKHGHKVLSIGGMPDHVHILFGFRPTQALSALIQETKRDSSEWINKERLVMGKFSWQEGYGAFSYSKSQISNVAKYIENQEKHHSKQTFTEEYRKILDNFGIEYDKRYIFHEIEQEASLQDAVGGNTTNASTERIIPNGMNSDNHVLYKLTDEKNKNKYKNEKKTPQKTS